MCHAHECGGVAYTLEHLAPGYHSPSRVVINEMSDLGVTRLNRRVNYVAGDDCVLSGLTDLDREVIDGMARRRYQLHEVAERVVALRQAHAA